MPPAVSVVVPCWNGGAFIDRLLASLAKQTFRDFETIIIDDGSTDAMTKEKLAALEAPIRVVRQENHGLPGARNTGFRKANTDFVLPLDCDDTIEPSFLAETYARISSAPFHVGFVFTHMRLAGARAGVQARHFDLFDQLFLNQMPYCMLIRKSAWTSVGGYDETMREGYEDWDFNIRLATAGFRGIEIARPLFVYQIRHEGMLVSRSRRTHGILWRTIRNKNPELYRISSLVKLWRSRPAGSGRVSPGLAAGLLLLAKVLPANWFGSLFNLLYAVSEKRHARVQSAA